MSETQPIAAPAEAQAPAQALIADLYRDLRPLARRVRMRAGGSDTLQTTALINEAYLKLRRSVEWNDREHFLRTAARAMRQILLDQAKERLAAKRGGGEKPLPLEAIDEEPVVPDEILLRLDEALERLGQLEPRLMQLVECRFYAGYSEVETAQLLGLSDRTVRRDWLRAKAWLYDSIRNEES